MKKNLTHNVFKNSVITVTKSVRDLWNENFETLEKLKTELEEGEALMLLGWEDYYHKMSLLLRGTYKFNGIPIEITRTFIPELDKTYFQN